MTIIKAGVHGFEGLQLKLYPGSFLLEMIRFFKAKKELCKPLRLVYDVCSMSILLIKLKSFRLANLYGRYSPFKAREMMIGLKEILFHPFGGGESTDRYTFLP